MTINRHKTEIDLWHGIVGASGGVKSVIVCRKCTKLIKFAFLQIRAIKYNYIRGIVAERQGFEPWEPVKAQRFSRPPRSTTPAPLRGGLGGPFSRLFRQWQEGFCASRESLGIFIAPGLVQPKFKGRIPRKDSPCSAKID